jgi:hypothetical protein
VRVTGAGSGLSADASGASTVRVTAAGCETDADPTWVVARRGIEIRSLLLLLAGFTTVWNAEFDWESTLADKESIRLLIAA